MDNLEEKYAARFEQSTTSSTQPPTPTPSTLPSIPSSLTITPLPNIPTHDTTSTSSIIHVVNDHPHDDDYHPSPTDSTSPIPVIHTTSVSSNTTPVIHSTSAPSDTPSADNATTTNDAFDHGFEEGYEAACEDFNGPPPDYEDTDAHTSAFDNNADNSYDDDYGYATDNCDSCGYDDGDLDEIDPEPPPW